MAFSRAVTFGGAAAIAALLAVTAPAAAYDYVPTANGEAWGVQDVAAPRVDTGSIRDTTSNALRGFGGLRVSVSTHPLRDGELLRGFRLAFNPPERFDSERSVDLGGVAISRALRFNRTANWGRWLDTYRNTTDAPITVKALFGGQLGIGSANGQTNAFVSDTASGDALATPDDAWVLSRTGAGQAASPQGPSAVVLGTPGPFPGAFGRTGDFLRDPFGLAPASAGHEANFVGYENDFTLQPGQVRTVAHFVVIGTAEAAAGTGSTAPGAQQAAVKATAQSLAAAPSFADLTKGQLCSLVNWDLSTVAVPSFSPADCATAAPAPVPPLADATPTTTGSTYDVVGKTIAQMRADMEAGRTTSAEITRAYLDRIAAYDRGPFGLNAMQVVADDALAQAKAADEARTKGDDRPLLGIPIAVKDLYDTKDMTTTNGSLVFEGYRPPTDATQVADLRKAGAIILGKASMEEYALSGQYSDDAHGQVWNAFEPSKSSIASSGGSAVATAASFAAAALGSQTGDSLYGPASAASLWTLRGTDGLASSHGVMPLSYLQDYAGSLARSASDLADMLDATTGTDPLDPTTVEVDASARRPADWHSALQPGALQGKRIGFYASAFTDPFATTGTVDAARAQLQRFVDAGATLVQIDGGPTLPRNTAGGALDFHGWKLWIADHPNSPYDDPRQILANPKRLPYRRQTNGYVGAGDMTDADVATYKRYRADAKAAVAQWLDAPPNPVVPGTTTASPGALDAVAFPGLRSDISLNDGGSSSFGRGDPPTNSAGAPTVAFPAGVNDHGEPLNLQLVGRAFDDAKLLGYAYAFDQVAQGHVEPTTVPALKYVADAPAPTVPDEPTPVPPVTDGTPAPATTTTTVTTPVPGPTTTVTAPAAPAAPAPATPAATPLALGSTSLRLDGRGRVAVRLGCPAGRGRTCVGRVVLRLGSRSAGSAAYRVAAGRTTTVRIAVRTAALRRAVVRSGAATRIEVRSADAPVRTTRVRVR